MIKISSSPVDPAALRSELRLNKLQTRILDRMAASQTAFSYDSLHQLQFELTLRNNIVDSAVALNDSGAAFTSFAKSRCNPVYWRRTEYGGFQLRDGARPSDAIRDIFTNGFKYAFECSTAMVILLYRAVLSSIGAESFNRLFPDILLYDWQYGNSLRLTVLTTAETEVLPGDILYFDNPDYDPETPEWRGENAVFFGNDTYFGHGIGITSAEEIIRSLNHQRKPGATRSAYLLDEVIRPDFVFLSRYSSSPTFHPRPIRQTVHERIGVQIGSTYMEL
ncbi:protein-glutamine gamma-glutamyltransferase [Brevibacillus massiliensis]|uniref:protein-glutamine gamma-glutamyltransferase n=1 Tax=Brevibacillus massiliensis TaxID=1118054 RepID=UPI000376E723|nr:protein-glutamine gamma-glutamyltransferase [Brevibacillus massiliensis]